MFRALNLSSHSTFFTAASILDKYFAAKFQQGISLDSESLYLLGMTVALMSSKLEDVVAFSLKTLIEKAGHGHFTAKQVIKTEADILLTLEFKL